MITSDCKSDFETYYHGSCTAADIGFELLAPEASNVISEVGRKKNLDRVFFTKDLGLAKIYAGRAARSVGGKPVLYRVVSPVDVVCMNDTAGATVYHASHAFVEMI
tara:strand:- start:78 stop:395 length:318 start_codon:yes stop_codon:yes gene_type:complete